MTPLSAETIHISNILENDTNIYNNNKSALIDEFIDSFNNELKNYRYSYNGTRITVVNHNDGVYFDLHDKVKAFTTSSDYTRWIWKFISFIPGDTRKVVKYLVITLPPFSILIFIVTMFLCCRYGICAETMKKKPLEGLIDFDKEFLFGPHFVERICVREDEMDYNADIDINEAAAEIKLGQIRYSIWYDNDENIAFVTVHEAKDIPAADISGFSDPFTKVQLKPGCKKEYKTEVVMSTLCPVYEETFEFKKVTYAMFVDSNLYLKVYDYDKFGGADLLGEAIVPIQDLDMGKGQVTEWRILAPEFKSEVGRFGKESGLGHICIGLGYSANTGFLVIFVLSCKDLPPVDDDGFADPYVTLFLVQDGKKMKKRKTTVKLRTLEPKFNEQYAFRVEFTAIEETTLMFVVADYDKGEVGTPIGQVLVGLLGQGLGTQHWEKMRRSPGKPICEWHMLKPIIVPD